MRSCEVVVGGAYAPELRRDTLLYTILAYPTRSAETFPGELLYTVKPPIFPTSIISNPLIIPVFEESRHLTYGKSLRKFHTSYIFQFQDIPRTLIPAKVVFYHASRWKIVFSYLCLGPTFLFEFILSTQFSVHPIQVLRKIFFSPLHHKISLENLSCLAVLCQDPSPLSIPPLFPGLCYSLPAGIIGGFTVLRVHGFLIPVRPITHVHTRPEYCYLSAVCENNMTKCRESGELVTPVYAANRLPGSPTIIPSRDIDHLPVLNQRRYNARSKCLHTRSSYQASRE